MIDVHADDNWAGCRESRKSCSGGTIAIGGQLIRAYSKTQANIVVSSVKAEYYSMVRAAPDGLRLKDMTEDCNRTLNPWMYVVARQPTEFLKEWAWANSGIWKPRAAG